MIAHSYLSLLLSSPNPVVVRAVEDLSVHESLSGLESGRALVNCDLEELQAEHTRLFVNSFPTLLCPPYESFYREGLVYGKTTNEVLAIYQQHGLEYVSQGEPADHISVELDFLAQTDDAEFLSRMRQWVPEFTERVKQSSAIYDVVARELEELLD